MKLALGNGIAAPSALSPPLAKPMNTQLSIEVSKRAFISGAAESRPSIESKWEASFDPAELWQAEA